MKGEREGESKKEREGDKHNRIRALTCSTHTCCGRGGGAPARRQGEGATAPALSVCLSVCLSLNSSLSLCLSLSLSLSLHDARHRVGGGGARGRRQVEGARAQAIGCLCSSGAALARPTRFRICPQCNVRRYRGTSLIRNSWPGSADPIPNLPVHAIQRQTLTHHPSQIIRGLGWVTSRP